MGALYTTARPCFRAPAVRERAAAEVVDLTEVVIVLNSEEAVKAFSRGGNVTVGGMSPL